MEIRIGRDKESGRLKLTANDQTVFYGAGNVPSSVLPEHCIMEVHDDVMRVKNLDINDYTYVNGMAVESKVVSKKDMIDLGKQHYPLDWQALSAFIPADIRPLRCVWERFENNSIYLQIAERKFNTLRSATGLITMIAIALSIATGGRSLWYVALYAVAIILSLSFFIKAYLDASKIPQKRQELTRQFQRDYVCPHCGHFLGNQSYDVVSQNDACPYCKTKFIH